MKIKNFADLIIQVQKMDKKSRVAVVAAQDEHTLEGVVKAAKDNLIVPILIGDEIKITEILQNLGELSDAYQIVPAGDVETCLKIAIQLVHDKKADVIMKGKLETGQLMKAIVNKESNLKKGGLISLIGFYQFSNDKYHKLLAVSDIGMNTNPDFDGKKEILLNALNVLHAFGVANPKVAVMGAVEKMNPKMPDTIDSDNLKKLNVSGAIKNCIIEGPISFDLATNKEAAKIKGYQSPVAGDADLLIVPDIVSGNMLVKSFTGFADAQTAGLVVGAKVPIVLTSRSAEASDKYYSMALAAYVAKNF
ncbi:phosphate acyltransferase [Acetobacterium sp. KB-1]|jgi:phosphotransacetylase|uniref:phosphate acyltransferase n=1 Tax=Acetobacterium sp. KB-1 TaxID=2184575 RepID=UPI000DBEC0EF|nr:phosphate acyltransferase [Acetobacterium sp. KB-1]AWW25874.1 phosphate butyryltransferase Ptb [Acetobacterium sp. KB-1]